MSKKINSAILYFAPLFLMGFFTGERVAMLYLSLTLFFLLILSIKINNKNIYKLLIFLIIPFILFFTQINKFHETVENSYYQLFDKGKIEESKFLFQRNIVFNPKDADSYLYLAKIYKQEENQRKEEYNLETTLLIQPDNEEALLMLMKIALEKSNYEKVKDLSDKFVKVCKNLCNENKDIQESLKNIEPENNES